MCNKHHLHDMVDGEYGGDGLIPAETVLKLFEPHNVNGEDIYIVLQASGMYKVQEAEVLGRIMSMLKIST